MSLHLPPLAPFRSPFRKPPSPSKSKALADLFRTFDGSLLRHLQSLLPLPSEAGAPPAVSFSYLSRAAGVLSSIHAVAGALISDPSLSGSDEAALSSYVNSSIKLLDLCNALSAEIERLHHRRLLLLFVAHLLSDSGGAPPPPGKIQKARESIREWEGSPPTRRVVRAPAAGLIRDLEPPPRGKVTALGRAIYAVEAVSALLGGIFVAFLGGELDLAAAGDNKVPREFGWAEAFDELRVALSGEICRRSPGEMKSVEASVRKLAEIIDEPVGDDENTERLRSAVKELGGATDELTEGLDRLRSAVNDLFRAALSTRNVALQCFRPGTKKCK